MNQQKLTREIMQARKDSLDQLIKRKFIYQAGFQLYGGVAGLYDYGPIGCAIKNNIEQFWREHFVIEEDMLEVSCTCVTPEIVLKTSGHVDKFADLLVTDKQTKQAYRADKLVAEELEQRLKKNDLNDQESQEIKIILSEIDGYKEKQMQEVINKYKIKSPDTGNDLTQAEPFNLMLPTTVGPSTKIQSYLRPETAQGIFLNFPRLLEQNGWKLPFGGAQIGLGFRNEIAPRNQLMRCREFQMAEIEYFVDPLDKSCPKFKKYHKFQLPLLSRQMQTQLQGHQYIDAEYAVKQRIIDNEVLAYFIIRTFEFLLDIGLDRENIRFRQHQADEMAHYSSDCWDAEVQSSLGWIECVGIADRSAFDLTAHSIATNTKLVASRKFKQPQTREQINLVLDKSKIGKEFKQNGTSLITYLENLSESEKQDLMNYYDKNDYKIFLENQTPLNLKRDLIKFEKKTIIVMEEKFIPNVIEPSFGIGRIIQSLIEHSFKQRNDIQRQYFKFQPKIAPYKCSLFTIVKSQQFSNFQEEIIKDIKKLGISCKTDDTNVSLGKKYARSDEIGIPFAITIDNETIIEKTITLREIDTTKQIRIDIQELPMILFELSNNISQWAELLKKYPVFESTVYEDKQDEESKE